MTRTFVALDFETTGLSVRGGDRVIEVAALRMNGGTVVERLVTLINPGFAIPGHITGITGISNAMVRGAPRACEVVPQLVRFIGDDVIVAHNASFDAGFLAAECARAEVSWEDAGRVACTMKLARRIVPGLTSYKLAAVASRLGVRFDGQAHRAEADANVVGLVTERLSVELAERFRLLAVSPELLIAVGNERAGALDRVVTGYEKGPGKAEVRAARAVKQAAVKSVTEPVAGPALGDPGSVAAEGSSRSGKAEPGSSRWEWLNWLRGR